MKWEDLVQRGCSEATGEEQAFEAGQQTNVSMLGLNCSEKGGCRGCLHGSQASSTRSLGCPEWGAGQVSSRMVEMLAGWGAAETTHRSIRAACHLHKTKQAAASVTEKGTADAVQIMNSTAWQCVQPLEKGSHTEQLKAGHSQPATTSWSPLG